MDQYAMKVYSGHQDTSRCNWITGACVEKNIVKKVGTL